MQNIHRPQRETLSESVHEKNIFGDYEHGSDLPRTSETIPRRGNGYSVKRGFPNNPPTKSIASKSSWKNSEEEEYMWDDINPRLTDHGAPGSLMEGWSPPRDSGQLVRLKENAKKIWPVKTVFLFPQPMLNILVYNIIVRIN